jgi:hypothetical protein
MKIKIYLFIFCTAFFKLQTKAQVSLQTGASQFSLPLFSYSDAGNRLSAGISLNYIDGNGLKVNETASSVGTGWALGYGGVISRRQYGEPDDQFNSQYVWPSDDYYPNGYLYSNISPNTLVNNGGGSVPVVINYGEYYLDPKYTADLEQDIFDFSFNGRNGQFVIDKNWNIRLITDSKLIISKVITDMTPYNIRTRISEFQITDESGITYVFQDKELGQVVFYDDHSFFSNYGQTQTYVHGDLFQARPINQFTVSKWYLSKIINPLSGSQISFQYEEYNSDMDGPITLQENMTVGQSSGVSGTIHIFKIKGRNKRILAINFSQHEKVEFIYSLNYRYDLPFDKYLKEILFEYDGEVTSKYVFSYGYFLRWGTVAINESLSQFEKNMTRLCLTSVKKVGSKNAEFPPYQFEYNFGNPNDNFDLIPNQFSIRHDHWGYSNNKLAIWYPWGGFDPRVYLHPINGLSYYYNLHKVIDDPNNGNCVEKEAAIGILKSIKYPTGGMLSYEYEQNTVNILGNEQKVGGVHVSKTTLYDGINHSNDISTEYKYILENQKSSLWGYEPLIYSHDGEIEVHRCGNGSGNTPATLKIPGSNAMPIIAGSEYISACNMFLGCILNPSQLTSILFTLFSNPVKNFDSKTATSYGLNGDNLLPMQFSRVEMIAKNGASDNGKTIYKFTSAEDYPITTSYSWPFANEYRMPFWLYGLPKSIEVKDKLNNTVNFTENFYTPFVNSLSNDPTCASQKWAVNKWVYSCYSTYYASLTDPNSDRLSHKVYYPLTGHVELNKTEEHLYNSANQSTVKETKYYYNGDYQLYKVESNNSRNEVLETFMYYPQHYTGSVFAAMTSKNIISDPVSSQTFITKNGVKYLVKGNVSEYNVIASGDIKPIKTYSFESDQPIDESLVAFNSSQLIPNTQFYRLTGEMQYNSNGIAS